MLKVICPDCNGAKSGFRHKLQRPRMPDRDAGLRFLQRRGPSEFAARLRSEKLNFN
jgi:hypothetical protein